MGSWFEFIQNLYLYVALIWTTSDDAIHIKVLLDLKQVNLFFILV